MHEGVAKLVIATACHAVDRGFESRHSRLERTVFTVRSFFQSFTGECEVTTLDYEMNIAVGMSGGIDSSVVAWLLQEQGHHVIGLTMTVWKNVSSFSQAVGNSCFSPNKEEDLKKTKEICDKIGIEHRVLDCSDRYEETVLKNFRDEYLLGRTPNPCVWCNSKIKFGILLEYARSSGLMFDKFATGHYARTAYNEVSGRWELLRGVDTHKDQSYFLYRLSQEQLASVLFPLGSMSKEEVRKLDVQLGFHREDQSESQDFYDGPYRDLLGVTDLQGNIVDKEGRIRGTHNGVWNYTIGQRRGLGVAAERPLYVTELRPETNEVVVGYEEETFHTKVTATQIVWSAVEAIPDGGLSACAKIRSTGEPKPGTVTSNDEIICFEFEQPVKAATVGQSLVVYHEDKVLCGGIITHAE